MSAPLALGDSVHLEIQRNAQQRHLLLLFVKARVELLERCRCGFLHAASRYGRDARWIVGGSCTVLVSVVEEVVTELYRFAHPKASELPAERR